VFDARELTGFVATADWFAIGDSRAREVVSYPVPDATTPPEERAPTTERWSTSRLGPRYLTLHNGQLHVSGKGIHRQLDPETGEVVNEFEPPSLFGGKNEWILLVDDQHAYVKTSNGLGAVDYTTNSVAWTSPDLEHGIAWGIRAGEYIIVIGSIHQGSPGITTLSADSGERVASVAPQSGSPTGLGRISSGAAGIFGYRSNSDRNVKSLVRVDPTDLSVMWEAPDIEIGSERPFLSVGTDVVLVDTTENGLAAVEAEDGSLRWSARGNFINHGLSANAAYGWANNSLLAFDIETGELITETDSGVNGTEVLSVAPAPTGVFVVTNETANFFAPA
jgi:outer membrane protein assembly factor BamB